jgi:hypothetical protein
MGATRATEDHGVPDLPLSADVELVWVELQLAGLVDHGP